MDCKLLLAACLYVVKAPCALFRMDPSDYARKSANVYKLLSQSTIPHSTLPIKAITEQPSNTTKRNTASKRHQGASEIAKTNLPHSTHTSHAQTYTISGKIRPTFTAQCRRTGHTETLTANPDLPTRTAAGQAYPWAKGIRIPVGEAPRTDITTTVTCPSLAAFFRTSAGTTRIRVTNLSACWILRPGTGKAIGDTIVRHSATASTAMVRYRMCNPGLSAVHCGMRILVGRRLGAGSTVSWIFGVVQGLNTGGCRIRGTSGTVDKWA